METVRSYKEYIDMLKYNKEMNDYCISIGVNPETVENIRRKQEEKHKEALREFNRYQDEYRPDPLAVSISNNKKRWRTIGTGGDSATDYIIIPDMWGDLWGTEEEETICNDIECFVFETVGYKSNYDFPTGKEITLSWSFRRVPSGVAIIHYRGIDW